MEKNIFLLLLSFLSSYYSIAQEVPVLEALPANAIEVKASSAFGKFKPQNVVQDFSFEKNRLVKNNTGTNMWISEISTQVVQMSNNSAEGVAWISFMFDKLYPIEKVGIWNFNQNDHTRRGLSKVHIQYTENGTDWIGLNNGNKNYFMLPESGGGFQQDVDCILDLKGKRIKGLAITADKVYGNHYHVDDDEMILKEAAIRSQNINYYGLGKVRFYVAGKKNVKQLKIVDALKFTPSQGYLKTPQGASREFRIDFNEPLYTGAKITLIQNGKTKKILVPENSLGTYTYHDTFLPGYMEDEESVKLIFESKQGIFEETIKVPAARKWELHFLPHSHQDIGYTHRQQEVMERQWDNLENAIILSEKTKNYPKEARFKWNTEATWSLHGYLEKYKGTDKAKALKQAIKDGHIGVDAPLGSILTGISKQEELMHMFDDAQELEKELGMEFSTAMFSDVPGAAWGMTSAFSQNNIKYFSSAPNYSPNYPSGGSRIGHHHRMWGDKPFYWASPSGEEKVLHWATGTGYSLFHGWIYDKLSVCGVEPLWEILEKMNYYSYPYPITYMRYTIHGDNGPPDYDMPETIKSWNEKYEYPKFFISTTKEVFEDFEQRFGDVIPTYSGDLSPLWDDGAASTARELSVNRSAAERLNQAEVLWSIMRKGEYPQQTLKDGWKYATLFSEHTWGASNSWNDADSQFTKDLWNEKKSYAMSADSIADLLLTDLVAPYNSQDGDYINVLNSNSWIRTDVVYFESSKDLSSYELIDENGISHPIQKMRNGQWAFVAKDVAPLSSNIYQLKKAKSKPIVPFYSSLDSISNEFVSLKIDEQGLVTSLRFNNDTHNYVSKDGLNKYIYSGKTDDSVVDKVSNVQVSVVEQGPVIITLQIKSDVAGAKSLIRELSLVDGIDRLDIKNIIDREDVRKYENVRFSFDFNILNSETNIDLGWASMFPERDQLRGVNKNFYNVLNQVGVMNTTHSVVLTTVDAPFVELGEKTAETWRTETPWRTDWQLTSTPSNGKIYSWVMNNSWTTNYKASQPGVAVFNYSISPSHPNKLALNKRKGVEAAQKLLVYTSNDKSALKPPFQVERTSQVAVSTIKEVEGGLLVRFFNQDDATAHFKIDWKTLDGQTKYVSNNKGEKLRLITEKDFWLKPYEVKSILITK